MLKISKSRNVHFFSSCLKNPIFKKSDGKEKKISTKVLVKEIHKKLIITSNFMVKPEYFYIKIPSIVQEKIANQIQISIKYELVEKK